MSRVCIGVHLHAEPERLRATLDSLRANTPQPFALLLLPDGPDEATRQALALLHTESDATPQLVTAEPHGAAACFNRLASVSSAEVLVLLESGALVGPAWLVYLLAALDSDPRNGIAGPTTNYAWNEQGVYPEAGATPEGIARAALDAARRFGGAAARTLEPLYSLADFCYAVRREVVETIGAAEEAYGLGPCWEMDYNIRAARAGWRGVWAAAAYVHRGPFTARRRREETQRFEASKRLYQDRFCGARLRGEKDDYRAHCRGDACPNFAPPALIRIHHTLPPPAATVLTTQPTDRTQSPLLPEAGQSSPRPDANALDAETQTFANEATLSVSVSAEPLVSCIMPTRDRRPFVPQALRCFLRQDYPHLELLILDDGADAIADGVPDDARVRYVRLGQKLSVGAKRNFACENARGEFIVHWDDDDWYPRRRVGAQLRALLEAGADLCGSSRLWYYDAWAEQAWEYHYAAPGAAWVGGNTLAYRKSFWARNRFPDLQVGEDAHFVWSDVPKTICDMADASLCVASLHPGNTSPKETSGSFWQARPAETVRALLGDEIYFYRTPQHETSAVVAWPLVSCMMPTRNRRAFVPFALQHFLRQDYPRKELIVIDDGDDEVSDLTQGLPGVRYLRCDGRLSIGAKRNLACRFAEGEIIAHWDDDDWYAPDRLRYQALPLITGEADLTGLENAFVLELPDGKFWTVAPQLHQRMFVGNVHGGTLVYRKELLARLGLSYPEIDLAEDAWLLYHATNGGGRLRRLENHGVFIYVRHGRNAWNQFMPGRFIDPGGWHLINRPHIFSAASLDAYRTAAVSCFAAADGT